MTVHPEHPQNMQPVSQDGLGSDDGTLLGPPPPINQPPLAFDPSPPPPVSPPTDRDLDHPPPPPVAVAPAAAMHVDGTPADVPLGGLPAAVDAGGVEVAGGAVDLPSSPEEALSPGSPDEGGPRGPRVCHSAPIFQGRTATIAREYAKDRAVYVHQRPEAGADGGAHDLHAVGVIEECGAEEEEEAVIAPGGHPNGVSLPVQRRGRGHIYAIPARPSREGAAAVLRGGELHGDAALAAEQQRAAVSAAEEDARVRARLWENGPGAT